MCKTPFHRELTGLALALAASVLVDCRLPDAQAATPPLLDDCDEGDAFDVKGGADVAIRPEDAGGARDAKKEDDMAGGTKPSGPSGKDADDPFERRALVDYDEAWQRRQTGKQPLTCWVKEHGKPTAKHLDLEIWCENTGTKDLEVGMASGFGEPPIMLWAPPDRLMLLFGSTFPEELAVSFASGAWDHAYAHPGLLLKPGQRIARVCPIDNPPLYDSTKYDKAKRHKRWYATAKTRPLARLWVMVSVPFAEVGGGSLYRFKDIDGEEGSDHASTAIGGTMSATFWNAIDFPGVRWWRP